MRTDLETGAYNAFTLTILLFQRSKFYVNTKHIYCPTKKIHYNSKVIYKVRIYKVRYTTKYNKIINDL